MANHKRSSSSSQRSKSAPKHASQKRERDARGRFVSVTKTVRVRAGVRGVELGKMRSSILK